MHTVFAWSAQSRRHGGGLGEEIFGHVSKEVDKSGLTLDRLNMHVVE